MINIKLGFKHAVVVLSAILSLFMVSASYAETIKIAVVGPITGPVIQYADMVKEGVYTAVERANAAGGYEGRKFEVVEVDDGCEPKQAPIAANHIVNSHINFVIGHTCSGTSIAAADIYENEGVLMISSSSTAGAFTDGKNYQHVFRTIGRDDQQAPVAAHFIAQKIKPKKVAVLHDKQSYGEGIGALVKTYLQKEGIEPVIVESINAGDNDYSAIITKLKSANVDFVYYGGYHTEMGLLLRQAAEQGLKARFMGPGGVGSPDITAIAGPAVEGMLLTLPEDFSNHPENADIVQSFKAKNRNPAGTFQLSAYTAAQVIIDTIRATHSTDPIKIAHYLHNNSFDTPIGKVSWNQQGDLKNFKFDVFTWHKDGTKNQVE